MRTVTSNLRDEGERLAAEIANLFSTNSRLRDVNTDSDEVMIIGPHYSFDDLPLEKKRLQSKLNEDREHFIAIARALLRTEPTDVIRSLDQHDRTLREVIDQTHLVYYSTTDAAKAAVRKAVEEIIEALLCLYDPTAGTVVLVPDTNALIHSPAFQEWSFDEFFEFEIVLVPTLLSELDSLKTEHRNPDVRQKAQSVIRQIKEYRRRGNLSDGVDVVTDRIRLRSTAQEPRPEEVMPWLDSLSPDDRLLASCIEVMRLRPRSSVILVTGDVNLQNKAEFARVPFLEPPTAGTDL